MKQKLAQVREALDYIIAPRRYWEMDENTIPEKHKNSKAFALGLLSEAEQKQIVYRAPHSIYNTLRAQESLKLLDSIIAELDSDELMKKNRKSNI